MPESYPSSFPCPKLSPYSWSVNVGLLRTPMDGGLSRQRRLFDVMPHNFQLEFTMPLSLLYSWQNWVNKFGYDYFEMEMTSWLSSQAGQSTSLHFVRFTSDLSMSYTDKNVVTIAVTAELSPAQVSNYSPPAGDNWILGGTPSNPSVGNPVVAGSPPSPSPDIIIAGSPSAPSL